MVLYASKKSDSAHCPRWRVRLFGKLAVLDGESVCLEHFPRRKGARLLARIALLPERGIPRLKLARDIWPDAESDKHRLASLRNELAALRAQLVRANPDLENLLLIDDTILRLNPAFAATDYGDWEAKISLLVGGASRTQSQDAELASLVEQAESAVDLLVGFRDDDWLIAPRYRFAERRQRALIELARSRETSDDRAGALECARRGLALNGDPELTAAADDLQTRLRASGGNGGTARPPASRLYATGSATRPDFPPLPPVFTSFFGREEETVDILRHVDDAYASAEKDGGEAAVASSPPVRRLLTITGTAGVGKTRLAQEILRRARQGEAAPRAAFVPLARVRAAADIPGAIAAALGVTSESPDGLIAQLGRVLRLWPTLLALDNMEHLLPAGRAEIESLIGSLLKQTPSLVLLVTSRERIGASFEREIPLLALPVPAENEADSKGSRFSLESLLRVSSIQLFEEQARLDDPDFRVSARNASSVAALCRRLDGLPLAIELVAARARSLTPGEILNSLDQRTALDHSRSSSAMIEDDRHRTLHDAVEWSHSLLPEAIRTFFNALSVFRGGFTLASAAAVCGSGDIGEAVFLLESLQDRHFVRADVDESTGAKRFRLLETMRDFGRRQLSAEEDAALARRHADHFLAFAEEAKRHETGRYTAESLDRQEMEHPNLTAAMDTFETTEAWHEALRLAAALGYFWRVRGHALQWCLRIDRLVAEAENNPEGMDGTSACPEASDSVRFNASVAAAANSAARLYFVTNQHADARRLCKIALARARLANAVPEISLALDILGNLDGLAGDNEAAKRQYDSVLKIGFVNSTYAHALHSLGSLQISCGNLAEGCKTYEQSLDVSRKLEAWHMQALTLIALGNTYVMQEQFDMASACIQEGRDIYRELKAAVGMYHSTSVLANHHLALWGFVW